MTFMSKLKLSTLQDDTPVKLTVELPANVHRDLAAYPPEARGRSERMFATLQDRLPKELELAGITTLAAANRFIAEVYLPAHNARFAIAPEAAGSAFVAGQSGRSST
jgi:hypothetical protein